MEWIEGMKMKNTNKVRCWDCANFLTVDEGRTDACGRDYFKKRQYNKYTGRLNKEIDYSIKENFTPNKNGTCRYFRPITNVFTKIGRKFLGWL